MSSGWQWNTYVILAPAEIDLEDASFDDSYTNGGGIVVCRDALTGPPQDQVDEDGNPLLLDYWPDGIHSDTPKLAGATAAFFARRHTGERLGARIYFARLSGTVDDWLAQAPAVEAGVRLAGASDYWQVPAVVLVLRPEDPRITAALGMLLGSTPIEYVEDITPLNCAMALRRGLERRRLGVS